MSIPRSRLYKKDVINCLRKNLNILAKEKQCLIRYYYQNLTIKEIAKLEDISKKTVIMYIKSAKEKLKNLVE
ncbi:MAG: RNA polymerase sigma factor [Acutalibacteraceae bacterium]